MTGAPARVGLGVALLLGLATGAGGCAHELSVAQSEPVEQLGVEQLEGLLWPNSTERYQLVTEAELQALERLVSLLYSRAEAGELRAGQYRRVAADAQTAGVEVHDIEVAHEGGTERLWIVIEPEADRRGRGSYLFRLGKLDAGKRARFEHVLEAPHSRYDELSGEIALGMFLERDLGSAPARALLLNSVHRHLQFNGKRERRTEPNQNPADAAHRSDHPLARATAKLLEDQRITLVQLHGFERKAEDGEPDVIVSAGEEDEQPASRGIADRLANNLGGMPVRHYRDEGAARLGGTINVQGRAAREARRCFVHVETSARLRARLRSERELRRRFAAAVFGGGAEEFRDGCS